MRINSNVSKKKPKINSLFKRYALNLKLKNPNKKVQRNPNIGHRSKQ